VVYRLTLLQCSVKLSHPKGPHTHTHTTPHTQFLHCTPQHTRYNNIPYHFVLSHASRHISNVTDCCGLFPLSSDERKQHISSNIYFESNYVPSVHPAPKAETLNTSPATRHPPNFEICSLQTAQFLIPNLSERSKVLLQFSAVPHVHSIATVYT